VANPTVNNPFVGSSQKGLAPQGDVARAYAVKRLQKQQQAVGRQTPGRVLGPPKAPQMARGY